MLRHTNKKIYKNIKWKFTRYIALQKPSSVRMSIDVTEGICAHGERGRGGGTRRRERGWITEASPRARMVRGRVGEGAAEARLRTAECSGERGGPREPGGEEG